jgi:hypothetical protein
VGYANYSHNLQSASRPPCYHWNVNSPKFGLSLVALAAFFSPFASAAFRSEVEPIVGYERVQKVIPTPHSRDRLVYGARLTVGIMLIAAELEYLNSTDNESFPLSGMTTKDVTDRAKLGARLNLKLARFLAFSLRGGVQATMNRHSETTGGVTTMTSDPLTYRPYLGAGLTATLARNLAFRADATAVFPDFPSFLGAEYQVTAGFVIRFP